MKDIKYPLSVDTWGDEERQAVLKVVESGNLTMGSETLDFEKEYAQYIGSKFCVACNSGSSANLLMTTAYSLRCGTGTVIVPAVAWSTSYSPFCFLGWKLKFVDIDRSSLNYDLDKLKEAYQEGDLILAVNLMGNPNDYREFPSMKILEDNCESMGAEYAQMRTGKFGAMASHSTYFSHHMHTVEGGMVTTDDEYFYQMLLVLRSHGFTRQLPEDNLLGAKVAPFEFALPGFNLRPTEIQCSVGRKQLEKLDGFLKVRRENALSFPFAGQSIPEWGVGSYYGFPLFSNNLKELKEELEERGIQYRPIMSGNFLRSPSIVYYTHEVCGSLENSDYVTDNGLFIGNHHFPVDWSFLEGLKAL